ncbi:MAG: DUF1501 domain-containing protein [Planctomycetes bacterium]|nr:DUF1501 domain-containing protein [Planctomycetota bacterium]
MLQAGAIGLMGLSLADLFAMRAAADNPVARAPGLSHRSVIYIFLSGGLAQQDSFDPKPDAPDNIRGEFAPIRTRIPGVLMCEHLPKLAERIDKWAMVRSLTHPSNDHSLGHHIMLTGRSQAPIGFNPSAPRPGDFPSIASVSGHLVPRRNGLPSAAVVPFNYIHHSGRIIPGQFAGELGHRHDPWLIQASHNCPGYGPCPDCFDHQRRPHAHVGTPVFQPPVLRLPEGLDQGRIESRRGLLEFVDSQRRDLERAAHGVSGAAYSVRGSFDHHRASAMNLLTSSRVRAAFDLATEAPCVLDAYGRNLFGYSCLMARRLVELGVGMIQVNLGRNETWDTHGNAFPHLEDNLLPPMDRCVSALLDDLEARGLLDTTMIVMAGEFGRTPRVFGLPQFYALPGRDHWGAVQTVFFAGGGVRGGTVIGSSDRIGGYPATSPQTPENMAATIYETLGLPRTTPWYDAAQRPHNLYHADPIGGLMG